MKDRRFVRLTQGIKVLFIEGTERGFDRGAEAGYALPNTLTEKRRPDARLKKNPWRSDSRWAPRMEFAIEVRALLGGDPI